MTDPNLLREALDVLRDVSSSEVVTMDAAEKLPALIPKLEAAAAELEKEPAEVARLDMGAVEVE